jgi:NAD+ kinase
MDPLQTARARVDEVFRATFGPTLLDGRLSDIQAQGLALVRSRDLAHFRSEAGDLLASVLQLCTECGWDPLELVAETLARIDARAKPIHTPPAGRPATERIALVPDSFDPPTTAQRERVRSLLDRGFSRVIVVPTAASALLREFDHAAPSHRAALVTLAFADIPGVTIDFDDISTGSRSTLGELLARHAPGGDAWVVVNASALPAWKRSEERLLAGGPDRPGGGERLRFAVVADPPEDTAGADPADERLDLPGPAGPSSEALRGMITRGEPIDGLVPANVAAYVRRHRLFLPGLPSQRTEFRLDAPRLLIVHDDRNPAARALAERYRPQQVAEAAADMILVIGGDGTMLRAIREHWKRRLPFLGLNAGHLGFLMNAALPAPLTGVPLVSLSLPLLRVDARFPDGSTGTRLAYGDAWLERAEGQSAWLRIDVNGVTKVEKVVGDGMLVATASGSSAYARALGAAPVPIDSPTLTLAGSNIFQPRFWKPMILPASSRIGLTSIDTIGKRPVRAYVDGLPLGVVSELALRQSLTASVELAFTREFEPTAKLLESLFPRDTS